MRVGSLFSGIGGIDLGLERAGMRVVWQCEQAEFCRRVLARHWPGVPCETDVRRINQYARPVDILAGGFPCQPVSLAGRGRGMDDDRWLWDEFARVIGELRPRYVLVENVPGLLARGRGMGRVLGDLAALGYDAEWDCVPAAFVGAPHRRDRVWIVAYASPSERRVPKLQGVAAPGERAAEPRERRGALPGARHVADADSKRRNGRAGRAQGRRQPTNSRVEDTDRRPVFSRGQRGRAAQTSGAEWWAVEPDVGRVAHGVPARLDRLAALGNAVVPQVAEYVGRLILDHERRAA